MEPKPLILDNIANLLVKLQAGVPINADMIDRAIKRLLYYQDIERAANQAFDALSRDNTYGPGPNAAWKLLGDALDRVTSIDLSMDKNGE